MHTLQCPGRPPRQKSQTAGKTLMDAAGINMISDKWFELAQKGHPHIKYIFSMICVVKIEFLVFFLSLGRHR